MAEIKIVKYADHPTDFPEMKWITFNVSENGFTDPVEAYISNQEIETIASSEEVVAGIVDLDEAIVEFATKKVRNQLEQTIANLATKQPMVGRVVSLPDDSPEETEEQPA